MAEKRGFGAAAGGFILAVIGFGLIVFEAWSTGTIPMNYGTYAGVGLAGVGIAVGAYGLDKSIVR